MGHLVEELTNADVISLYKQRRELAKKQETALQGLLEFQAEYDRLTELVEIAGRVDKIHKGVACMEYPFYGTTIETVSDETTRYARLHPNVRGGFNLYLGDNPFGAQGERLNVMGGEFEPLRKLAYKWVVEGIETERDWR